MIFDRTDEATFRASVPRTVQGVAILEVLGFRPGGFGVYAAAVALGRGGSDHRHSTHLLVCMDDDGGDEPTWVLYHGHYDHPDRETAKADLLDRAGYTTPPRPGRRFTPARTAEVEALPACACPGTYLEQTQGRHLPDCTITN